MTMNHDYGSGSSVIKVLDHWLDGRVFETKQNLPPNPQVLSNKISLSA